MAINILKMCIIFLVLKNSVYAKKNLLQSRTTVEILRDLGHTSESHQVQTEDGYILTLHRIPYQSNNIKPKKGPILLVHGLLCSSADWVVTGDRSLGITLAQNGYDVWLGNNRGNTYSRKHVYLDPDSDPKHFFAFSYHEMGKYDLPAMVDYILEQSNVSKIPYVGFSEGTTQFWVMMSERPEYNTKISIFNAWAPVTDMHLVTLPAVHFIMKHSYLENVLKNLGLYELASYKSIGKTFRFICKKSEELCSQIFYLSGQSWNRMPNKVLKNTILENFPAGMSLRQVLHYLQGAYTGVFAPYDFGREINFEIYGKALPEPYNISATNIPVVLYYGDSDFFINISTLKTKIIPALQDVKAIPYKKFNHLDFIWNHDGDVKNLVDATLNNLDKLYV